jgi:23S rRNA (cytidine1920-2'-O)/16S rRNA (cytidine1409-2'-O)-methyltransferase
VGGFTDCLLQTGTARVYAVDTGYGILDYRLRIDERVVVCERTNLLFWSAPEPMDLVVIDAGWTRQELALPAAARMLKDGGLVLSLVKPQYEADKALLQRGVLPEEHRESVLAEVREAVPSTLELSDEAISPVQGSGGNREVWFKLAAAR